MAGGRTAKKAGRGDVGRAEATRQSRRVKGMSAEVEADNAKLAKMEAESNARKKAEAEARKAARLAAEVSQEGEAASPADVERAEEPTISAVASQSAVEDGTPAQAEVPGGEEPRPESELVSVEKKEDSQVIDLRRDSNEASSSDGVEIVDPPPTAKTKVPPEEVIDLVSPEVKPQQELVEVDEEMKLPAPAMDPDADAFHVPASRSSPVEPDALGAQSYPWVPTARDPGVMPPPQPNYDGLDHGAEEEARAKTYVAEQVRRWEQVPTAMVHPPNMEFAWRSPDLDASGWKNRAVMTSRYLHDRSQFSDAGAAWLRDLRPERWCFGMTQDLYGLYIPAAAFSPRECAAFLQTLLFEAGFRFMNVVPEYFRTRVTRPIEHAVYAAVEDLQRHLSAEMNQWQQLTAGLQRREVKLLGPTQPDADPAVSPAEYEDKSWDVEMSEAMDEQEAGTLGYTFARRFITSGLSRHRDLPSSSGIGDSSGRPSLGTTPTQSTPSAMSYSSRPQSTEASSLVAGVQTLGIQEFVPDAPRARPGPTPSSVGPTGASDESWPSTDTSRNSSTASSLLSMGHAASAHMPTSGSMGLVMTARTPGSGYEGAFGMSVTRTVYHRPEQHQLQDDQRDDPNALTRYAIPAGETIPELPESEVSSRSQSYRPSRDRESSRGDLRSEHTSKSRRSGRSSRSERSRRSGSSRSSMSVASQVALNIMRQEQEKLAEMRRENEAYRERERQAQAEMQHTIQQTLAQQRREMQETMRMMAAKLEAADTARKIPPREDSAVAAQRADAEAQETSRRIEETLRREREQMEAAFHQRWQQQEAAAEAQRTQWMEEARQNLGAQVASLEEKVRGVERERDEERVAAENRSRFYAGQICDLRATLAQHNVTRGTAPVSEATPRKERAEAVKFSAVKAQEAPPHDATGSTPWAASGSSVLKTDPTPKAHVAVKTEAKPASRSSKTAASGTDRKTPKHDRSSRRTSSSASGSKKSKSGSDPPPSDSDPSSDSSDDDYDDSSSSDSDDSLADEDRMDPTVSSRRKDGTVVWTYRPFISYNSIEKFNEHASLEDRVGWWERFIDVAAQGAWSDEVKIRQLRGRFTAPLRDWFTQLPKSTRRNWKKLSRRFKKMYCRTTGSYSERYFTMKMKNGETSRQFFYRLNAAAVKAEVPFQSKATSRERHIRRFIKKLKDSQLKVALQGQSFKTISDLEHALRRHEDVWREEGYDTPPPKSRDFRADNIPRDRYKSGRTKHAFVIQDAESESGAEPERSVRFRDKVEDMIPTHAPTAQKTENTDAKAPGVDDQELTQRVYRVVENMGWRPPFQGQDASRRDIPTHDNLRPEPRSPRRDNPFRDEYCEKCHNRGHSADNCWKDIICDRCGEKGHPSRRCFTTPCGTCGKFHRGKPCEDMKTFQELKELARQGSLQGLPEHLRNKLLKVGEANPGDETLIQ